VKYISYTLNSDLSTSTYSSRNSGDPEREWIKYSSREPQQPQSTEM